MTFWALLALEVAALVMGLRLVFRGSSGAQPSSITRGSDGAVQTAGELFRRIFRAPLVLVLAYALLDHVALEALHRWLDGTPKPFAGIRAAGYHASVGLVLGWPAVLAAAAWAAFAVRPAPSPLQAKPRESAQGYAQEGPFQPHHPSSLARDLLVGVWVTVVGSLAAVYPLPRGWTAPLLHACELGFVAAALAALPAGWRSRAIVTPQGRALGVVLVGEMCNALVGAWAQGAGVFAAWNSVARWGYLVTWAALCGVLARR